MPLARMYSLSLAVIQKRLRKAERARRPTVSLRFLTSAAIRQACHQLHILSAPACTETSRDDGSAQAPPSSVAARGRPLRHSVARSKV